MYYRLVYYLDIDSKLINQIRKKYDPTIAVIAPHITIMFPIPESVGKGELVQHIESVLKYGQSFPFHLLGLQKSWDHWLFLTLAEGNKDY
ncbi:MAG: 2'-5' RNA ligase family protein [bacterium]